MRSRWLSLKGRILAGVRDFDRSFELLDEAVRVSPDDPRSHVVRAQVAASNDDVAAAIASCRDALELTPHYGPAVQHLTHYLLQSNEIEEAFDVLTTAVGATQDGNLRMQLAVMLSQQERFEEAAELTKSIERFFPLADPMRQGRPKRGSVYASIASLRSDLAYHGDNYPASVTWATRANDSFHDAIASSIRANHETGRRVQFKVPFVLQKHVTCAPATLTMLSGFWDFHVDQEKVVDDICYDGTAPVKIRSWAEENGMVTREFRVTFRAAQDLIDAGIPFGLSTVDPGMGHIQVICGYDSRRSVLLIQDPGAWYVNEALATKMIDEYEAFGPRGLVLIPKEQADRLESLDLPDADLFDSQHAIAVALQSHDRETAASIAEQMKESFQLVRRAAKWAPSSSAAWEMLLQRCRDRGKESEAVDAARELVASRPHDVHSHLRLAEMLHREDQCEESLAVIADAMQLDRRESQVHSLFALRLYERKYYEQALAACSPPEVDPQDAHHLDVLAAKILYYTDQKSEACERLRNALHRDPTDLESWVRLADWCEEINNMRWYDEASKVLVQRASHIAVSHCYYATTLIRENRRERAKEQLEYAVEIDPTCHYALLRLVDLMFEDHQVNQAEALLDRQVGRVGVQPIAIGRLMIAGFTNDAEAFVTTLRDLPEDSDDVSQIAIASSGCQNLDIERNAEIASALARAIRKGKPNKAIGYAWAHFFCLPSFLEATLADFHRLRNSEARNTAGAMLLGILKHASQADDPDICAYALQQTNRVLRRLGKNIYQDSSLWSHTLWTLIQQSQYKRAVAIAKKYARVKDRDVDDLVAAMIAALYHRDFKLLRTLLADAENLGPSKMTENGRLLRAMYDVHCSSDEELKRSIGEVDKNQVDGPFLRIAKLISIGAECLDAGDESNLVKQWKIDFFREYQDDDPIDQTLYLLLRSRIAAAAGDSKRARRLRKSKYSREGVEA